MLLGSTGGSHIQNSVHVWNVDEDALCDSTRGKLLNSSFSVRAHHNLSRTAAAIHRWTCNSPAPTAVTCTVRSWWRRHTQNVKQALPERHACVVAAAYTKREAGPSRATCMHACIDRRVNQTAPDCHHTLALAPMAAFGPWCSWNYLLGLHQVPVLLPRA